MNDKTSSTSLEHNMVPCRMDLVHLTRAQRLILGLFVLLLVNVIWVLSSELTEYIFHEAKYDKPFFTTYVKTSMFMLYLAGFAFWKPWRDQCTSQMSYSALKTEDLDNDDTDTAYHELEQPSLSEPSYVPIKYTENVESGDETSVRAVRFSKVAEVRQLSPEEANDALLSRLSYSASQLAEAAAQRAANRLPVGEVARLASVFCVLWFMGNYSYQAALSRTEAAVVNVLSSCSSLFTLLLSACLPSGPADKFSLSKCIAVLISIAGVVMVSLSDFPLESKTVVPTGALMALVGASCYAAYLVLLKRKVQNEDQLDLPMFFGFVGAWNTILLWPGFLILHYTHIESFVLPTWRQFIFITINGLIGTVLSEILWLWGCFLTSSLTGTLAMSLSIPLSMLADVLLKHVSYSSLFYFGALPIFMAFFAVTLFAQYDDWDPAYDLLAKISAFLCCLCKKFSSRRPAVVIEDIENAALIDSHDEDNKT